LLRLYCISIVGLSVDWTDSLSCRCMFDSSS